MPKDRFDLLLIDREATCPQSRRERPWAVLRGVDDRKQNIDHSRQVERWRPRRRRRLRKCRTEGLSSSLKLCLCLLRLSVNVDIDGINTLATNLSGLNQTAQRVVHT